MGKVLVFDTSVLCVWLRVRGFDRCGPDIDVWDYERIDAKIRKEESDGTLFVLPIATIIETGNHITHANGDKLPSAEALRGVIENVADASAPWAAFEQMQELFSPERLKELANKWIGTVNSGQSLGDASIADVAEYYSKMGKEVEIFTADAGLKSYQPILRVEPRRRRWK